MGNIFPIFLIPTQFKYWNDKLTMYRHRCNMVNILGGASTINLNPKS